MKGNGEGFPFMACLDISYVPIFYNMHRFLASFDATTLARPDGLQQPLLDNRKGYRRPDLPRLRTSTTHVVRVSDSCGTFTSQLSFELSFVTKSGSEVRSCSFLHK